MDFEPSVTGVWREPGHAQALPARLSRGADGGLVVTSLDGAERLTSALASAVTISSRVGNIARHLEFPGGGDFETADNNGIDALQTLLGRRGAGVAHGLEQFRPRLIVIVAAIIALAFGIYRFAIPVMVEVAVAVTPPVVPQLMSQSVLASLDQAVFTPSTIPVERQQALHRGFEQLVATASTDKATPRRAYTLNFRKGQTIGPNAFALPDGTVVVTDELVEMAGKDDELILGVLGHEIGHVVRNHSLRQLYRAAGVTALIMMIGGDIGGGAQDVLVQGSALLQLSHSRSAEAEADRFGVDLMYRAGKDPAAVARFFEIMRDKLGDSGKSDFFASHPATEKRIEETRKLAEDVKAGKTILP